MSASGPPGRRALGSEARGGSTRGVLACGMAALEGRLRVMPRKELAPCAALGAFGAGYAAHSAFAAPWRNCESARSSWTLAAIADSLGVEPCRVESKLSGNPAAVGTFAPSHPLFGAV